MALFTTLRDEPIFGFFPFPTTKPIQRAVKDLILDVFDELDCSWLEACRRVVSSVSAPSVRYEFSRALHQARLKRSIRVAKKAAHVQRQEEWFAGGRTAHYLAKYGRFGGHHAWLKARLERGTGMTVSEGHTTEWCVCPDCEEPEHCLCSLTPTPRPSAAHVKWDRSDSRSDMRQRRKSALFAHEEESFELLGRSPALLARLRFLIAHLRGTTLVHVNAEFPPSPAPSSKVAWTVVAPQSDGLVGDTLDTLQSGNVVLTEANLASSSIAAIPTFRYDWHQLCSTETTSDYSYLTDRYTYYKTLTWKTSDVKGVELPAAACALPCDFVDSVAADGSMPMFMPFKIHQYFKSDIEIRIHVNSNKFQVGQLQFSWQYMEEYDGNKLNNIYSRSQLPHVCINAGNSNEAVLTIPYKYYRPYLNTVQRTNGVKRLYLGHFRCFVVAPLAVGDGGPDSCNISLFIRFPNSQFTGLRDGSIVQPQMEAAAAAMVATAVYDRVIGDRNADNPSQNVTPSVLVPTASHSWCAGTGLSEQVVSLRLDHSTRGVGRTGIDSSETSIGVPCRVFGMLKHFDWSVVNGTKNTPGSLLYSCDVHPQLEKDKFNKFVNENALDSYCMPPVSVIAGLYMQWRGSLEFRFDIIASQFHTGRLLCGYIPGFYGNASNITLAQARNSPHVEFSLQDSTSFTFIVPYISNSTFWPRRYTGPNKYAEATAPSKLVVYVLNPLIPMQSVVDSVTIVPYVRAGVDFEVSVPVQPAYGLSDVCTSTQYTKDLICPTAGSYPYRVTNYEGFGADKKYIFYEGTAALGTASTFTSPPRKLQTDEYIIGKAKKSTAQPIMVYKYIDEKTQKEVEDRGYASFIVLWHVPDKGNFGIPFPEGNLGEARAKRVAKMLKQGKPVADILKFCFDWIEDSADTTAPAESLCFSATIYKIVKDEDYVMVDAQMMEQRTFSENSLQPTANLPSTSGGNFNFNESFVDLKDLCRRYQLYADVNITLPAAYSSSDAFMSVPVVPHGLLLETDDPTSTFNLCRDGHIPIVSSGYIYNRGSLRFRFVFSSDSVQMGGGKIWVQHHPDAECTTRSVVKYPNVLLEDGFKGHSYGFFIQALDINSIIELEIPFYKPDMYGICRKPLFASDNEICKAYNLGCLAIGGFIGKLEKKADFNCKIYYSIGDDFSFSTFRGFPPMVYCDEVWAPTERVKKREITWITAEPQMEEAQPQMMGAVTKFLFTKAANSVKDTATSEVKAVIAAEAEKMRNEIVSAQAVDNSYMYGIHLPTLVNSLIHLVHIAANPTPTTIAISVAGCLSNMLMRSVLNMLKLIETLKSVFNYYWDRFVACESAVPQGDSLDFKGLVALGGLIFSAVASLLGYTCSSPKNFPDVMKGINTSVSLVNNVIRFVQNCSELIVYCFNWISCKLNPLEAWNVKLDNSCPEIKKWYSECVFLLDVRTKDRFLYDKSMMARVFDAGVVGSMLVSGGLDANAPGGKIIYDTYKEVRKLQVDLVQRGVHPDVRFEPFPIFITGKRGIGKSFLVKRISKDLLEAVNYTGRGSLIYDIAPGAKYWSGCDNPAVLVSDDIFQVSGTIFEDEIRNLFMICSSSVLNPPMAAVEDKEKRINPLLYIMLCNHAFPNLSPVCKTPEAIYRRRKYLIEAQLCPRIADQYPDFRDAGQLPPNETINLAHLQFRYAHNVTDPETTYTPWMTYIELIEIIKPDFVASYARERDNFVSRMRDMYHFDPDFDDTQMIMDIPGLEDQMSLKDQIDIYRRTIQLKIDAYNDPLRGTQISDVFQTCKTKLGVWAERFGARFQMDEPSTSTALPIPMSKIEDTLTNIAAEPLPTPEAVDITCQYTDFRNDVLKQFNIFKDWCVRSDCLPASIDKNSDPFFPFQNIFSYQNQSFVFKIDLAISQYFSLAEEVVQDSWYFKTITDLINVGSFSLIDKIKFLLVAKHGPGYLANAFFNQPCPYYPDFEINIADIGAGIHAMSTLRDVQADRAQRDPVRAAFKNLNYTSPVDIFHQVRYDVVRILHQQLLVDLQDFPCKEVILDYVGRFQVKGIITDFKIALQNFKSFYMNLTPEQQTTFYSASNAFATCISAVYIFAELCGINLVTLNIAETLHSTCVYSFYQLCHDYPNFTKYCGQRDVLSLNSTSCKRCPPSCIYGSDFIHYFHCAIAVTCAKSPRFHYDSRGEEQFNYKEVDDFRGPLRRRNIKKLDTWLENTLRYTKHFLYHTVPSVFRFVYSFIIHRLPHILAILGASVALCFLASGASSLIIDHSTKTSPQGNYYKFEAPRHSPKPLTPTCIKAAIVPQMSPSGRVSLAKRIERSTVLLFCNYVMNGERTVRSCRCLMLRGTHMLVLRHFIEEFSYINKNYDDVTFTLYYANSTGMCNIVIPFASLIAKIAWCSASDQTITSNYGIVTLPPQVPTFKDITKIFAPASAHKNVPSFVDLYVVNGESSFNMPMTVKNHILVRGNDVSSAIHMESVYSYGLQYSGLCGSVLVAPTLGSGNGAIIGLHVAGSDGTKLGYAEPLYYETFASFFNITPTIEVQEMPTCADAPEVNLDSNLMMYGTVPKEYAHKESGKSKIVPSLLHNTVYSVKTQINPLQPNDPRQPPGSHPLRDGCNKHGSGDVRPFSPSLVEKVEQHMSDRLQQVIRPIRTAVTPLTLEQAVCGDVDVPYFEAVNWKSSEGFPLSSRRPKSAHDKRWLFDLSEGQFGYKLNKLHPELAVQMRLRDKCFENNIKPITVYVDCLKDYRLKPEKCAKPGSTRIFSIAPIQCSLDVRMHLTDFTASLKNSRITNSIGIGINPDSMEWTQLVNYLFEVGTKIVTLDYSNFGPCLMSQLVASSNNVIVNWHQYHGASPSHVSRVRWLLDNDILNPVHLCSNVLYQTVNGIASGSPLTGECNSIPNLFYIRLTFLEIMTDHFPEYAFNYYFDSFVRIVVYGDDLIMSVSDQISEIFNSITIRDYLLKHGITVTSAQKSATMVPYTSIYDATFLKRSFKEHPTRPGIWLGPIERTSIEECINWVHASDDPKAALIEACRSSLDLAYSQGPDYYDAHYQKIKRALNDIGLTIDHKTWFDRDASIFDSSTPLDPSSISVTLPKAYSFYS